jgi:hypothetical protein
LLKLVNGIFQLYLLFRRQVIHGDIHDIMNIRHLESARFVPPGVPKSVFTQISTSRQAHSKPNEASLTHVPNPKRASQFS